MGSIWNELFSTTATNFSSHWPDIYQFWFHCVLYKDPGNFLLSYLCPPLIGVKIRHGSCILNTFYLILITTWNFYLCMTIMLLFSPCPYKGIDVQTPWCKSPNLWKNVQYTLRYLQISCLCEVLAKTYLFTLWLCYNYVARNYYETYFLCIILVVPNFHLLNYGLASEHLSGIYGDSHLLPLIRLFENG